MSEKNKRYEKQWSFDFGKAFNAEAKHEQFSAPRDGAQTAEIIVEAGIGVMTVEALPSDSPNLFEADITYIGEIEFSHDVSDGHARLRLRQRGNNFGGALNFSNRPELNWSIKLHPSVAVALKSGTGAGSGVFNLDALRLTEVKLNTGAGQMKASLPAMNEQYTVSLQSGAGELEATIAEGANIKLLVNVGAGQSTVNIGANAIVDAKLSGGVGQCNVSVVGNAPVRVKGSGGIGSFSLPDDFVRVSGGNGFFGREGIWETAGFADAERRIKIDYSGGVGELKVRRSFAVV